MAVSYMDYTAPNVQFTYDLKNNNFFTKDARNLINALSIKQLNTLGNVSLLDIYLSTGNVVEPHIHQNASELVYCISGAAVVSLINPFTKQLLNFPIQPGQVANVPQGWWHYEIATVDNTHLLAIFDAPVPEFIPGSDLFRLTPASVLAHTYCLNEAMVKETFAPITGTVVIGPPTDCNAPKVAGVTAPPHAAHQHGYHSPQPHGHRQQQPVYGRPLYPASMISNGWEYGYRTFQRVKERLSMERYNNRNLVSPTVIPQPIRRSDGAGGPDFGPRDVMRDLENPNMFVPPITDSGLLPNMKMSFSDTHMQLNQGGWSREITVRDLPIATTLAGVNMSLIPGGVRELHWHQQAEWAFMIRGCARITSVDWHGRNFIADVGQGDLWYFPAGLPIFIQALESGCEFLLVFDDGDFSDLNTLTISDWFAHTPRDVLAANFGIPMKAFNGIPSGQVYIFRDQVPGALESQEVQSPYGTVPLTFNHKLLAQEPLKTPGGTVRIADSSNFPIAKTIAAALVEIEPGAMRELHWHPNNDEWQYYLSGQGRMTVFGGNGKARTFDYRAGDVGYVPYAMGHYVQNTGKETLWFLEMFKSPRFEDISLNQWMALTPHQLVKANLNASPQLMKSLRKVKWPVVKYPPRS